MLNRMQLYDNIKDEGRPVNSTEIFEMISRVCLWILKPYSLLIWELNMRFHLVLHHEKQRLVSESSRP